MLKLFGFFYRTEAELLHPLTAKQLWFTLCLELTFVKILMILFIFLEWKWLYKNIIKRASYYSFDTYLKKKSFNSWCFNNLICIIIEVSIKFCIFNLTKHHWSRVSKVHFGIWMSLLRTQVFQNSFGMLKIAEFFFWFSAWNYFCLDAFWFYNKPKFFISVGACNHKFERKVRERSTRKSIEKVLNKFEMNYLIRCSILLPPRHSLIIVEIFFNPFLNPYFGKFKILCTWKSMDGKYGFLFNPRSILFLIHDRHLEQAQQDESIAVQPLSYFELALLSLKTNIFIFRVMQDVVSFFPFSLSLGRALEWAQKQRNCSSKSNNQRRMSEKHYWTRKESNYST